MWLIFKYLNRHFLLTVLTNDEERSDEFPPGVTYHAMKLPSDPTEENTAAALAEAARQLDSLVIHSDGRGFDGGSGGAGTSVGGSVLVLSSDLQLAATLCLAREVAGGATAEAALSDLSDRRKDFRLDFAYRMCLKEVAKIMDIKETKPSQESLSSTVEVETQLESPSAAVPAAFQEAILETTIASPTVAVTAAPEVSVSAVAAHAAAEEDQTELTHQSLNNGGEQKASVEETSRLLDESSFPEDCSVRQRQQPWSSPTSRLSRGNEGEDSQKSSSVLHQFPQPTTKTNGNVDQKVKKRSPSPSSFWRQRLENNWFQVALAFIFVATFFSQVIPLALSKYY